jgi:hypothetical protein
MKRGILLVRALKAGSLEQQAKRLAVEVKLDQLVPWSELKFTNGVSQEEVEEGRGFVGEAGGVERK